MAGPALQSDLLLDAGALLTPDQARTFICHSFHVPPDTQALRLRLVFDPPRAGGYNNLLTLSLFDPQGFRGAGHRHAPRQEVVLGRRGATPGFLPGPLPAGEWLVEVDCHCVLSSARGGVEYTLRVEAVRVEGAEDAWKVPVAAYLAAGRQILAARAEGAGGATAIPEYVPAHDAAATAEPAGEPRQDWGSRWLKGDLHVHSQHSDGKWSMDDLVRYVAQNRLDFIAVADHNTTSAYEDVRWSLARAGLDTVVIPAMELTTFWGHANALGVREWIDWRVRGPEGLPRTIGQEPSAPPSKSMQEAAGQTHHLGGLFVVNHPRSSGYPACTGCRWEMGDATAGYADALEVWNGAWAGASSQNREALALWDRWLNAGYRIPATAGTDAHRWPNRPEQQGYTYAWVAHPTVDDILAAVRAGETYLSCGPRVAFQHLDLSPAALTYEVAELGERGELHLVRNGETVCVEPVKEDGLVTLVAPSDTPPGGWYRAELWRPHSTMLLALTNPVWVD